MNVAYILALVTSMLPLIFKTSQKVEALQNQIKSQKNKLVGIYSSHPITYELLWEFLDKRESLVKSQTGVARTKKVHIFFLLLGILSGGLGLLFSYILPQISSMPMFCACIICIVVNATMTVVIAFTTRVAEIV